MGGVPATVCAVGGTLCEGPVWVARDRALWFVDIKRQCIHRFEPESGALRSYDAPAQVGWVLPADDGGMVAGLQGGIARFDPGRGAFAPLVAVEADRPGNRLNDAVTDLQGRIWFGSMDDAEAAPCGDYYRFERGRVVPAGLPSVCITNGPALSPDCRTLYSVDTLAGLIHASDVGVDGRLSGTREFARITPDEGYPDGPTVDAEGGLWIGLFFGWQARRYAPDGTLTDIVRFPVGNITKLAFGGDDLRTVYATTARLHLKPGDLAVQPEAGNLFAFRAEVPGVPVTPVAL